MGTLDPPSLLFAGSGGPVWFRRRRCQRLEIARGPSLHVVVSNALAHRLHPAPSLVLRGGDRPHDGLLDALDVDEAALLVAMSVAAIDCW